VYRDYYNTNICLGQETNWY